MRSSTNHKDTLRRAISAVAILAIGSTVALTTGIGAAQAAAGQSGSAGQYLSGGLLSLLTPAQLLTLESETATNDGTQGTVTHRDDLGVSVLGGAVTLNAAGGVQIPLNIAHAGVLSQYALADQNGHSVGATGLVSNSGAVGVTANPGIDPGDLTFDLSSAVANSTAGAADIGQLANLKLTLGATSSRAERTGTGTPLRHYEIADADLHFTSPAVGTLVSGLNTTATTLGNSLGGLAAKLKVGVGGLVTLSVSTPSLTGAISSLLTGTIGNLNTDGVTINLATGDIEVNLDHFADLNDDSMVDRHILTGAVIGDISDAVTGLLGDLVTSVGNTLQSTVNGITVKGDAALGILHVDTTLGDLLSPHALPAGQVTVIGLDLSGIVSGLKGVVAGIAGLTGITDGLTDGIGHTAAALLDPAITGVLGAVLDLETNVQTTSPTLATVTALRVGILPVILGTAGQLDLATSSVGSNIATVAVPTLTGIVPDNGPETGGTTVTLTGTGFDTVTGVLIGGKTATPVIQNDTTLTFVTPPHPRGAVTVAVDAPQGTSNTQAYTYTPVASTVTGIDPDHGPDTGGTVVTITGTGFTGVTNVSFGADDATSFTIVNPTTITATSPAHPAGPVAVTLTNPIAGSTGSPTYTFDPSASTLLSIDPDIGPETGGQTVTIDGTGLLDATGATFDGIPGTDFTPVSDTVATVVTPAHSPATVPFVLVNPAGNTGGLDYKFVAEPSVATSIVPDHGPDAGGTAVVITGTGFLGATGVTFNGKSATGFDIVSDTEIDVTSPSGPVGPPAIDVVVHDPAGNSAPLAFTYDGSAAHVTSIVPGSGPETGGTDAVITGTGFLGATDVTFSGTSAAAFTIVSDTTIDVTTPVHAVGDTNVVVHDPAGDSTEPLNFTFTPVTHIISVDPPTGPEAGGTTVTITGNCFLGATGVRFGTVLVTDITVVNDTTITVVSPPGVGTVDVTVVGSLACGNATDPGAFTYTAAASVAGSLTPDHGTDKGGTHVTITGSGFTGASGATFGGKHGTHFRVVNDTTITVQTPAHTAGPVGVFVIDRAGDAGPLDYRFTHVSSGSPSDPGSGSNLAFTGYDPSLLLLVILMLLLSGAAMVTIGVRRSRH